MSSRKRWQQIFGLALAASILVVMLGLGVALGPRLFGTSPAPTERPIELPLASASLHETWSRPADGMLMVYVPGGTFLMGSDESDKYAYEDVLPQHSVTLDGFWIDQTEVSNAQYRQCAVAGACQAPTTCDWGAPPYWHAPHADHPVICVDWYGAVAYCKWAGARLPTEAEWEYAALGPGGFIYPWGNDFEGSRDNFREVVWLPDGYEMTAPVGSCGASWCDAMDLAGNVAEWVADWYGGYRSEAQTKPVGPTEGDYKVWRGGGFFISQTYVHAAFRRDYGTPDSRYHGVGFRCAGQPGE